MFQLPFCWKWMKKEDWDSVDCRKIIKKAKCVLQGKAFLSTFADPKSARGETGRHATLRGWCPYGCGSSNLLVRTKAPVPGLFLFLNS